MYGNEFGGEFHNGEVGERPGQWSVHWRLEGGVLRRLVAARPSGTENIDKIYAESFQSEEHLQEMLSKTSKIVDGALES